MDNDNNSKRFPQPNLSSISEQAFPDAVTANVCKVPESPSRIKGFSWLNEEKNDGFVQRLSENEDTLKSNNQSVLSTMDWVDGLRNISVGDLLNVSSCAAHGNSYDGLSVITGMQSQFFPQCIDSLDAAINAHNARFPEVPYMSINHPQPSIWDGEETCNAFAFQKNPFSVQESGPIKTTILRSNSQEPSTKLDSYSDLLEKFAQGNTTLEELPSMGDLKVDSVAREQSQDANGAKDQGFMSRVQIHPVSGLSPDLPGLLRFVLEHVEDKKVAPLLEGLVEARFGLQPILCKPHDQLKDYFLKDSRVVVNMKYIDPTYMIRAVPSNASDNVYCSLLAQSAVHGATAGFTGFTVGLVDGLRSQEKRQQLLNEIRALCDTLHDKGLVEFHSNFYTPAFGQISITLKYMNEGFLANILHIVHREIKPANLLINLNGEPKIADSGICAGLENFVAMCTTFVGTVTYMSPERINNEHYSYPADIWSLELSIFDYGIGQFP